VLLWEAYVVRVSFRRCFL